MSNSIVRVNDTEIPFDFSDADFDKTVPATPTLILSTMCANVAVMGLRGLNQIRVTARGRKSFDLKIQTSGPETMISAPLEYLPGMSNFGGNINISGTSTINGVLYIDGRAVDSSNPMIMLVMVPYGTTIKIGMVLGKKVVIRDVCGALEAKLQGITNIEADYFTDAKVKVSGSGSFKCGTIEGENFSVKISGMGDAVVNDGNVTNFQATVSGMGNISFNGTVSDADLSVSGMGSITLMTCTGKLSKSKTGMGKIKVINDLTKRPGINSGFEKW